MRSGVVTLEAAGGVRRYAGQAVCSGLKSAPRFPAPLPTSHADGSRACARAERTTDAHAPQSVHGSHPQADGSHVMQMVRVPVSPNR